MSIRTGFGVAVALFAVGPTLAAAQEEAPGIWISREEIATLPMSGAAWEKLVDRGSEPICTPLLSDLDDKCNITVLAKALLFARTGDPVWYDEVKSALIGLINSGPYSGRALPLSRRLGAYVIAADIVDFENRSPVLHNHLKNKLLQLRDAPTIDGPASLVDAHETRLNNWGTSAGFTRLCIDLYVDDDVDLARTVDVWKGWMGDRQTYGGFEPGDLSWQADPENPRGINAAGSTIDGWDVDGVLPDEQRVQGPFAPPPYECLGSVPGAFQGALCATIILDRHGHGASGWEDRALERAGTWFTRVAGCPLQGDDSFEAHLFNFLYPEMNLPIRGGDQAGKLIAFADWTHGPWASTDATVGNPELAGAIRLRAVGPNPWGESVALRLELERATDVRLRVVDVRGRDVATLHTGRLATGVHRFGWDGRDLRGERTAPGVYFVTAGTRGWTETVKVIQRR